MGDTFKPSRWRCSWEKKSHKRGYLFCGTAEDTACYPQSSMERTHGTVNPETRETYSQSRLMCAHSIQGHLPPLHSKQAAERVPGSCEKNHSTLKRHSRAQHGFRVSVQTPHQGASPGKVKAIPRPTPATYRPSVTSLTLARGTRASHSCLHAQPKY